MMWPGFADQLSLFCFVTTTYPSVSINIPTLIIHTPIMPSNDKSVETALKLLKQDRSKMLGLTVGKHNITEPGQYVPRAGNIHLISALYLL